MKGWLNVSVSVGKIEKTCLGAQEKKNLEKHRPFLWCIMQ